jgi:hypothetical protein
VGQGPAGGEEPARPGKIKRKGKKGDGPAQYYSESAQFRRGREKNAFWFLFQMNSAEFCYFCRKMIA